MQSMTIMRKTADQVQALLDAKIITPSQHNETLGALRKPFEDNIVIVWNKSDIINYAEDEMDIQLTDDQAEKVMFALESNFDASEGMNWNIIKTYIAQSGGVSTDG